MKSKILKLFKKFHKVYNAEFKIILRYSTTGIGNTLFFLLVGFLLRLNSDFSDNVVYSISAIFGFIFSLVFNLSFTFKSKINLNNIYIYILCFLISLFISSFFSKFLELNDMNFGINQLLSMGFYSLLNFILLRKLLI